MKGGTGRVSTCIVVIGQVDRVPVSGSVGGRVVTRSGRLPSVMVTSSS